MAVLLLVPTLLEASFLTGCPERAELFSGPVAWQGFDLALSGMGPVDAGVAASHYLARRRYERCVLAGLAGGYAGRAPEAPSLVEARDFLMDGLGALGTEGVQVWETLGFPDSVRGSMSLATREQVVGTPTGLPQVHALTVSACSATSAVAQGRVDRDAHVQIEEMEGFAVARACRMVGVPLTCLRAISNEAGDRDKSRWCVPEAMGLVQQHLETLLP